MTVVCRRHCGCVGIVSMPTLRINSREAGHPPVTDALALLTMLLSMTQ